MKPDQVRIEQTMNGGFYAHNLTTKDRMMHYIRKTKRGAIGHAKSLWPKCEIVNP